jgi:hypothetical protein
MLMLNPLPGICDILVNDPDQCSFLNSTIVEISIDSIMGTGIPKSRNLG